MKRSKSIGLSFMGAAPFLITACDMPSPPPPQAAAPTPAYGSVEECIAAGIFTEKACNDGQAAALQSYAAQAPRYDSASSCEQQYGTGNCQPVRTDSGSWFMPAMAGFMMGQMLSGGGHYGGYRGAPIYGDRYDRGSWRTADNRPVPRQPKMSPTRSRGGFGSQAAARGRWGGGWGG